MEYLIAMSLIMFIIFVIAILGFLGVVCSASKVGMSIVLPTPIVWGQSKGCRIPSFILDAID